MLPPSPAWIPELNWWSWIQFRTGAAFNSREVRVTREPGETLPLSGLVSVSFASKRTGWLVGTTGRIIRIDF